MKAIKLIITFIVILGCVVGAFFLLGPSKSKSYNKVPDNTYETYRKQFALDWEQKGDWDEEVFLRHFEDIQILKGKDYDVASLNELNTKTATQLVKKRIFGEWDNSQCSKTKIDNCINAIKLIEEKDPKAKTYSDVVLIKNVYSTYITAYSFANKKIGLTPSFNGTSWNSFSSYSKQIKSQKAAIESNENYKKYLSGITAIKNALSTVDSRLASAKDVFYSTLANKIYLYYENIHLYDRTAGLRDDLVNAIDKYESEYSYNSKLRLLRKEYNRDVYSNSLPKQRM